MQLTDYLFVKGTIYLCTDFHGSCLVVFLTVNRCIWSSNPSAPLRGCPDFCMVFVSVFEFVLSNKQSVVVYFVNHVENVVHLVDWYY